MIFRWLIVSTLLAALGGVFHLGSPLTGTHGPASPSGRSANLPAGTAQPGAGVSPSAQARPGAQSRPGPYGGGPAAAPAPIRPSRIYGNPGTGGTDDDAAPVGYARYFFSTDRMNSPATQAARWPLLIGQGNQLAGARAVKAANPSAVTAVVYADPLYIRRTDPDGVTTATNNANTWAAHQDWLLRDANGDPVRAIYFNNQDYAADIGNTDYQRASAAFLLDKIKKDGWDGVFLDDTNPTPSYSFSTRPAKYPTDASWQQAELSYITTVCGAVRAAGKACHLNLGARNTTWAQQIAVHSDGPMDEFFVAGNPAYGGMPSLATIENGYWTNELKWAAWLEQNTRRQIMHASTSSGPAADYALTSFLLVSQGKGAFAANRDYTSQAEGLNFTTAMADARKLGRPLGGYVADPGGIYYRDFAHGRVVVNPHSGARTFGATSYPATTGVVTLR